MRPNKELRYLNTLRSPQLLTVSEQTLIPQYCSGAKPKCFTGMVWEGGGNPEAIYNLILKIIFKRSCREYNSNMTLFVKQFIQSIHKRMVRFQKVTRNLFLTLHGHNVHRQQRKLSKFPLLTVYVVPV